MEADEAGHEGRAGPTTVEGKATFRTGVMLGVPTVQLSSSFWMTWFEVAAEHARLAVEARAWAERAPDDGIGTVLGAALADEMKAALVAVTASAFTVDAWYIAVRPNVPDIGERRSRSAYVVDTLKAGFDLRGAASRWGRQLKKLYRLRDGVAHHTSRFSEGGPHPSGRTNVSAEMATYTAEQAVGSVDLALDVVTHCLTHPRPVHADLVSWCGARVHVVEFFERTRSQNLGEPPR